jgi:hypothetical protein
VRQKKTYGSAGAVCVCVWGGMGGKSQLVCECPLESPLAEGEWPIVVRRLLLSKRRPHFKTNKRLGKSKHVVTGYNWIQNDDTVLVRASWNLPDKPNWQKDIVTRHLKGGMAQPEEAPMLSNSLVKHSPLTTEELLEEAFSMQSMSRLYNGNQQEKTAAGCKWRTVSCKWTALRKEQYMMSERWNSQGRRGGHW